MRPSPPRRCASLWNAWCLKISQNARIRSLCTRTLFTKQTQNTSIHTYNTATLKGIIKYRKSNSLFTKTLHISRRSPVRSNMALGNEWCVNTLIYFTLNNSWWHRKLSLRQLTVPPVTTEYSNQQTFVFSEKHCKHYVILTSKHLRFIIGTFHSLRFSLIPTKLNKHMRGPLQKLHCWSSELNKLFRHTVHNVCNFVYMLGIIKTLSKISQRVLSWISYWTMKYDFV